MIARRKTGFQPAKLKGVESCRTQPRIEPVFKTVPVHKDDLKTQHRLCSGQTAERFCWFQLDSSELKNVLGDMFSNAAERQEEAPG